jgi:(E)-4-hydroxy-3-methylbut-2-enyl-diphosphate synthase
MKIIRRKTKVIKIGNVYIGDDHPIAIQSMTKTKTADIEKTVRQIKELEKAGCQIIRLAVKDSRDADVIRKIKERIKIPLVADIHFDWRLALEAIDNGADKIRLNPGNIYKKEQIKEVVNALKLAKIPLRIGVNSGSVRNLNSKKINMADKLVASALNYIKIIESLKFYDIVISLKASNVLDTVEAYRKLSKLCDYPLHLGVTATGSPFIGAIKSSIALGSLLLEGIGDTIRVSLTDKPTQEVIAAKAILESLGLRPFALEIISCPTCGRCEVDLIKIVNDLEKKLLTVNCKLLTPPPKVAVMGCMVNGPGEAKEADIGIAFGKKEGILFRKGKCIKKVSFANCVDVLLKELGE